MPLYDYVCACGHQTEDLVHDAEEEVICPKCDKVMERQDSFPNIFSHIIPTYPGSQRLKAGYQHKYVDRAATKTQVGAGGSVSVDHPTGSLKNK